mgnify:FL=1|tara:strand:+ start:1108 stop:1593 length:486 start_codon:yes stop_codon:yes gene_type:complete
MLVSIDNLLDNSACDNLIEIFNSNKQMTFNYNESIVLNCLKLKEEHKLFVQKVSMFVNGILNIHAGEVLFPDNIEIVLKQPGVSLDAHLDREHRDYASITYLNSLDSGHTNIENFGDIKPEKGRTIFFKGNKMKHGNRNPEKDRYTFISWYTKDANKGIFY